MKYLNYFKFRHIMYIIHTYLNNLFDDNSYYTIDMSCTVFFFFLLSVISNVHATFLYLARRSCGIECNVIYVGH